MQVQQILSEYIKATNSHNFQNVSDFLAPNAIYYFMDKKYINLDEIEEYFHNSWNLIRDEVYSISDVQWIGIDNNLASCLYVYHWEGYHNDRFVKGSGRATNIFAKFDDDWKLIHEHLSPNK